MSDLSLAHATNDSGQLTVTVGGRLAIDTVAALHALLTEHLPQAGSVRLDAASLAEIDLCGMQLICSACHTALLAEKPFSFSGEPPACIQQAISSLGLQDYKVCKYSTELTCLWCGGTN